MQTPRVHIIIITISAQWIKHRRADHFSEECGIFKNENCKLYGQWWTRRICWRSHTWQSAKILLLVIIFVWLLKALLVNQPVQKRQLVVDEQQDRLTIHGNITSDSHKEITKCVDYGTFIHHFMCTFYLAQHVHCWLAEFTCKTDALEIIMNGELGYSALIHRLFHWFILTIHNLRGEQLPIECYL